MPGNGQVLFGGRPSETGQFMAPRRRPTYRTPVRRAGPGNPPGATPAGRPGPTQLNAATMSYGSGRGEWRVRITGHESVAGTRGHQRYQELRGGDQQRGPGGYRVHLAEHQAGGEAAGQADSGVPQGDAGWGGHPAQPGGPVGAVRYHPGPG
jgi:hypothetical protein